MKITIAYDNKTAFSGLTPDWGFSCIVDACGYKILFDTGAKAEILFSNLDKLNISIHEIDEIFISHDHWDHNGSLDRILEIKQVPVYLPSSYITSHNIDNPVIIENLTQLHENIFSTGELAHFEQSLAVNTKQGLVVIAGCSHPGVRTIIQSLQSLGTVNGLIGGLHGFDEFDLLNNLKFICPTHCTINISAIKELFPDKYLSGGVGRIISYDKEPS